MLFLRRSYSAAFRRFAVQQQQQPQQLQLHHQQSRSYSSAQRHSDVKASQALIDRIAPANSSVALFSLSTDIHYNLALENYIAENADLKGRNIMLLWISSPSVVIGRHQNVWVECDTRRAADEAISIARRYSGGGCVYHDGGNLNISFICHRSKYDRKTNLELIKRALDSLRFSDGVTFEVSPRYDMFMRRKSATADSDDESSFKISGSASRLAANFCYHHCTLLFDADLSSMKVLRSSLAAHIVTKATPSVRSKCHNIRECLSAADSRMSLSDLVKCLCEQYWSVHFQSWGSKHLFNYVNPQNLLPPASDISELIETNVRELRSWEHIYGTTPKFQLEIPLDNDAQRVVLEIANGRIKDMSTNSASSDLFQDRFSCLIDAKLDKSELVSIFNANNLLSLDSKFRNVFDFINKNL